MESTKLNFDDLRDEIIKALDANKDNLGIDESTTLVNGFYDVPGGKTYEANSPSFGSFIPAVALVGDDSCRIYLIGLKKLFRKYGSKTLDNLEKESG